MKYSSHHAACAAAVAAAALISACVHRPQCVPPLRSEASLVGAFLPEHAEAFRYSFHRSDGFGETDIIAVYWAEGDRPPEVAARHCGGAPFGCGDLGYKEYSWGWPDLRAVQEAQELALAVGSDACHPPGDLEPSGRVVVESRLAGSTEVTSVRCEGAPDRRLTQAAAELRALLNEQCRTR